MLVLVRHWKETIICISVNICNFSSAHNIRIHIYWIYWVRNHYNVSITKQVCKVTNIALSTIGNKYLISIDIHSVSCIIVLNSLTQEFKTSLWAISHKGFCITHLVCHLMNRFNDLLAKRKCNISNSKADNRLVRMLLLIFIDSISYLRKQVAFFKIHIVFINLWHILALLLCF